MIDINAQELREITNMCSAAPPVALPKRLKASAVKSAVSGLHSTAVNIEDIDEDTLNTFVDELNEADGLTAHTVPNYLILTWVP